MMTVEIILIIWVLLNPNTLQLHFILFYFPILTWIAYYFIYNFALIRIILFYFFRLYYIPI